MSVQTSNLAFFTKFIGAKGTRQRRILRDRLTMLAFVGPFLIGLLLFTYYPVIRGFYLSFFQARGTVTPTKFIGLENYQWLLSEKAFTDSLVTFVVYTLLITPATFALTLGLAVLVNNIRFGTPFFRTVFFLPTAVSFVIGSLIWKMSLFSGLPSSFVNQVLLFLGQPPVVWVSIKGLPYYWVVLVTIRLWLMTGGYFLILLAGLQDIPRELYEAAYVDGAVPGWSTFRHITLPLLSNVSISVLLLIVINAFQAFAEFYNILGGMGSIGLRQLVRPPLLYLYDIALGNSDYGRGSAGSFILMCLIVAFTLVQVRLFGLGRKHN